MQHAREVIDWIEILLQRGPRKAEGCGDELRKLKYPMEKRINEC
jgi:hypothetical protein